MRLTKRDVEKILALVPSARESPISNEKLKRMVGEEAIEEMLASTQMARLSNGWIVMLTYEYQRPAVLCRHLSIGFREPKQATVYAISRIMEIIGFHYPLRVLPGWEDVQIHHEYPLMVHVFEPVNCTLQVFHALAVHDELSHPVQAGGAAFSD